MSRRFSAAAMLSLLLSLGAATAWALSYSRAPGWRLIATAHSEDLTRLTARGGAALFTTTANWSKTPNHGFWDAWWVLSQSGRLTLLTQVIDYEGTLRLVYSAPPMLVVDVPTGNHQVAVFRRVPGSTSWHGFASHAESQQAGGAPVTARAWMVTLPYWFLMLPGLPIPLAWLRARRRRRATG